MTDLIGNLPGYPNPVWYHLEGIANILSLHRVGQSCRIYYDDDMHGQCFNVTKPDGTVCAFQPSVSGLHFYDTHEYETMLINTVAKQKDKYTDCAYMQAAHACRIQDNIGWPSIRDYMKIVDGGCSIIVPSP